MQWLALIGLSLASFITAVDFAIVNTALPAIQKNLLLTTTELQWVMNIFVLTICIFMATMGRVGDIYGHKKVLYAGVSIFGIASLVAGCATSAWVLILCRALQGFSVAAIIPASLALISALFADTRGKAIGIWTSINGIGMAIGPALGGIIVSSLSWRWIFFINIPFVIASLLICWSTIHTNSVKKPEEKVDWLGFLCLAVGIGCFVLALINGDNWGWFSMRTWLFTAVSIIAFLLLLYVEKNQPQPLINFQLFKNKQFFAASIVNFLILFFGYTVFFLAPLYLQNIRDLPPYWVGLMLLPISAMVVIVSPYGGYLYDRYKAKLPLCLGSILLALSALLQIFINLQTSYFYIGIAFALMGIAWGVGAGPASAAGIAALPERFAGVASGVLWTIRNLGGSLGLAFAGAVFHIQSKHVIYNDFANADIPLSELQQQAIDQHIANPHLIMALLNVPVNEINKLLYFLKSGFIAGLQSSMLLLSLISLLAFFCVFFLNRNL